MPLFHQQARSLIAIRMTAEVSAPIKLQSDPVADLLPDTSGRHWVLRKNRPTGICLRLETQDAPDPGARGIGQKPAHDVRDRRNVPLSDRAVVRQLQWHTGTPPDVPRQFRERFAHRVKIAFALDATDREAVPTGLRHVDVDRDLPEPAVDHERVEKFGMLEQRLAVRHEHGHEPDAHGVAHDFDQLFLTPSPPIRVGHIAAGDLQSAAGTLETPVRVDLLLHLRERRNRYLVRVLRQITVRAMERAIARAGRESAMGEMAAGQLVGRAQFGW